MRIESVELFRSGGAVWVNTRLSVRDAESAEVAVNNAITALNAGKNVDLTFSVERQPRSTSANKMLWACLTDIALAVGADKWEIYLECLKRYTKPTMVVIGQTKLESFRSMYREIEVISETTWNGQEAYLVACYVGSSKLSKEDFSRLLDGVLSEMREVGLETPADKKIQEVIDAYEASV